MKIVHNEEQLDQLLQKQQISRYFTDFNKIRPGIRLVEFPKSTFIYSVEEHRKYVFFLVHGKLKVTSGASDGSSMLIMDCNDFIFLGDMELMGYSDAANTIQTVTECQCISIDLASLKQVLLNDNVFLRFLCRSLADKLACFGNAQRLRQLKSPLQNLAEHMLAVSGDKGFFHENLRNTALTMGVSYRHLHRLLHALVEKAILQRSPRGYEIIDMTALQVLSGAQKI